MKKRILVSALLAMMLAACSSKPAKETVVAPKVEEKPVVAEVAKPVAQEPAKTAPTETAPIAINPLKDPNNILSKRSIYFDFDKDEVKAEFLPLVEAHAAYLLAHPEAKVFLQGNADERGAREYNLSLGQRRAVAVKKVLNLKGVQDKQIETVSFGEEKATANCRDESCFKLDRRSDIAYENE